MSTPQEIPATVVMKLRHATGLSMMECKKALVEAAGDFEKATDLIRIKLKGKMDARTDRATGAGRIAISMQGTKAAIVEVRAETDFTAINEKFIAMTQTVADLVAAGAGDVKPSATIQTPVDEIRITTGENCSYARGFTFVGSPAAKFGAYVHHDGKTGVLIHAEGDFTAEFLKDIGMHIVATVPSPKGVSADDIPAEIIERERTFRVTQAIDSGKPKEIAEKMVEGGMRKFFEEIALLEQPFVKDPTRKVKDMVGSQGKIIAFKRWAIGETA